MTPTNCPHCQTQQSTERQTDLITKCPGCQEWYITTPQDKYDRFDLTAVAVHLFYKGMKTGEIPRAASNLTNQPRVDNPSINRWVRLHTTAAVKESQKYRPNCGPEWLVLQSAFPAGAPTYYAWTITDTASHYILATQITDQPALDPKLARTAIQIASSPPRSVLTNVKDDPLVQDIARNFHASTSTKETFSTKHAGAEMIKLHLAMNEKHRQFTRNRHNIDVLNTTMSGLALIHNLFDRSESLEHSTPAEAAGIAPIFTSWADVVKRHMYMPPGQSEPTEDSAPQPEDTPQEDPLHDQANNVSHHEIYPDMEPPPQIEPAPDSEHSPALKPSSEMEPTSTQDIAPETQVDQSVSGHQTDPDNDPGSWFEEHSPQEEAPEHTPIHTPTSQTASESPQPPDQQNSPPSEPTTPSEGDTNTQLQKLFDKLLENEAAIHQAYLDAQQDRMAVARVIELMTQT